MQIPHVCVLHALLLMITTSKSLSLQWGAPKPLLKKINTLCMETYINQLMYIVEKSMSSRDLQRRGVKRFRGGGCLEWL